MDHLGAAAADRRSGSCRSPGRSPGPTARPRCGQLRRSVSINPVISSTRRAAADIPVTPTSTCRSRARLDRLMIDRRPLESMNPTSARSISTQRGQLGQRLRGGGLERVRRRRVDLAGGDQPGDAAVVGDLDRQGAVGQGVAAFDGRRHSCSRCATVPLPGALRSHSRPHGVTHGGAPADEAGERPERDADALDAVADLVAHLVGGLLQDGDVEEQGQVGRIGRAAGRCRPCARRTPA